MGSGCHIYYKKQKEFRAIHYKEIEDVINNDKVWSNTEVLIAVGAKDR